MRRILLPWKSMPTHPTLDVDHSHPATWTGQL